MPADPDLLTRLRDVLQRGPRLRLAVLFGSAARGTLRADSDVDVAILLQDAVPLAAELTLQVDLGRAAGREADLVQLDTAPTLVRWQVARYGVPLLEVEPHAFTRFQAAAATEYLDFAPALRRAEEIFRRRLTEKASWTATSSSAS